MQKIAALVGLAVAVSLVSAPSVQAQQPAKAPSGTVRGYPGGISLLQLPASLATKLKLTDEQKSKMEMIRTSIQAEVREAFQDSRRNGGNRKAQPKLREIAQKANADAVAILTPEQKTTFTAWQADAVQYQDLGVAGTGLLNVDGLAVDQKSRLKALAMETGEKRRALFRSTHGGDRQASFQKRRALESDTEAAVRKILTADQVKQFDAGLPQPIGPRRRPDSSQKKTAG